MTDPQRALVARLSADFTAISAYLARASADLTELDRLLANRAEPAAPQWIPAQYPMYAQPPQAPVYPAASPPRPQAPPERSEGWIGKVLAVAGVAVTLIGVVLLLVLAAQAGILRPEVRVAAGAALAAALVAAAHWLYRRPGGRVGAIALAATGVAAAYMDVIAATTIYAWIPAAAGLALASAIGGGGLMMARRWNSEHLGLLVLVPLIGLAPLLTDGITLLLIGFMLALTAASLPVQYGRDWLWMYAARTAASTVPLLLALTSAAIGDREDLMLATACVLAAMLAITGALVLLRATARPATMAVLAAVGVVPLLCVSASVDRVLAALMISALAAGLLAVVALGDRLPGVVAAVRGVWGALSAAAALVAVIVAFDGSLAGPVLLAMAIVVGAAGGRDAIGRWAAAGFGLFGGAFYLGYAPPRTLVHATEMSSGVEVSVLVASILVIGATLVIVRALAHVSDDDTIRALWIAAAAAIGYAVTTFTVTLGVLIGGTGGGFFAGHMAATICWIAAAAGLFTYAARQPKSRRSLPIGAGLALVAAAMAKLFLFDLGTLGGIFRVAVFIVVGQILLGMGAGYARLLSQQGEPGSSPTQPSM
ncbi:DUF2339 domain-containing protein [Mycobacterium sp. LTG2003]